MANQFPRTTILNDDGTRFIDAYVIDPATVGVTVAAGGVDIRLRVADELGVLHLSLEQYDAFIDAIADKIVETFDTEPGHD